MTQCDRETRNRWNWRALNRRPVAGTTWGLPPGGNITNGPAWIAVIRPWQTT